MPARTPLVLGVPHVAVICSDYERSKRFYAEVLGLEVVAEVYREARRSYKLDLKLPEGTQIELFRFPDPPERPSYPEACGLRHLAFAVADLDAAVARLQSHGVAVEPVRVDEYTGKQFTFFADPDGRPSNSMSADVTRRGPGSTSRPLVPPRLCGASADVFHAVGRKGPERTGCCERGILLVRVAPAQ